MQGKKHEFEWVLENLGQVSWDVIDNDNEGTPRI